MAELLEQILAQTPFFEGLEAPYLELLTGCAANARYDRGDYLFVEEEEAKQFFVIRHGIVAIEAAVPGKGRVAIQNCEAGDIVGWPWYVPPYHWHYSGRAIELTRVLALDGACLRCKFEQNPALGYEFMKRFSHKVVRTLDLTRLQLVEMVH